MKAIGRTPRIALSLVGGWQATAVLAIVATLHSTYEARAATIGPPVQIGSVTAANLSEISGIVDGRATANVFWVHNDSGDTPRFFAIDHAGALLGTFPLAGAGATDWEDIAIGPKPGGGNYLYLGDIGDNNAARPFITVYRTAEPLATASATIPATDYATAKLQYPAGARNAESMLVDPLTNDLFLITKSTTPQIYSAPASAFDQPLTILTAWGGLGSTLATPSAADISPDGRHILVRNRTAALLFERGIGQTVADALHGVGIPFTLGAEPQGEAIAWATDGASFYTASEFDDFLSAPIHSYAFTVSTPGNFDGDGDVDADDLPVWQERYGINGGADANADGATDGHDFLIWQQNLAGPPAPPVAGVPEPTGALLVVMSGLSLIAAGRHVPCPPPCIRAASA